MEAKAKKKPVQGKKKECQVYTCGLMTYRKDGYCINHGRLKIKSSKQRKLTDGLQSSTSHAEVQSSTSNAEVKPSTSHAEVQSSTANAAVKPSTSHAEVQSSTFTFNDKKNDQEELVKEIRRALQFHIHKNAFYLSEGILSLDMSRDENNNR